MLQEISQFQARELIVVGGGSQNSLWNQIKADVTNLPIKVLPDAEITALGAAMFAWYGCGFYATVEQARKQVEFRHDYFYQFENKQYYHINSAD